MNIKILKNLIVGGVILLPLFHATAQTPPVLNATNASPDAVQLGLSVDAGTAWRILCTPSLNDPNSWGGFEDFYATDTNGVVTVPVSFAPAAFFRLVSLDGSQGAQIFFPTNGQVASGLLTVRIGADIWGFMETDVYLDGAMVGSVQDGALEFNIETSHFTNGLHSLYIVATDNQNGQCQSDTVTVDFENSVRWLDADVLFSTFVPIDVESDIFPGDWTVTVQNESGDVIRTFSGTTSDGTISTNWDGADDLGNQASELASYNISIEVTGENTVSQSSVLPATTSLATPVADNLAVKLFWLA